MLTAEELRVMRERCAAATAGPWHGHVEPYEHWHQAVAYFDKAHAKGISPATHFVLCDVPDPDRSGYLVTSLTGNGKDSQANAAFMAHARADLPRCLDEIERLRGELALSHEVNVKYDETVSKAPQQRDEAQAAVKMLSDTCERWHAARDEARAEAAALREAGRAAQPYLSGEPHARLVMALSLWIDWKRAFDALAALEEKP